mgnify:CR=1 FL=1
MKIVELGPMGAGKDLQGKLMSSYLHVPHISTGDMFRQLAEEKNPLGLEVKDKYWGKGNLVPDEVVTSLVKERLNQEDCKNGFILDGFPRNIQQALDLEKITKLDHVFSFNIPDNEVIDRLKYRELCKLCNIVYGRDIKPKKENTCDKCQTKLTRRKDDNPEIVKERLKIYHDQTTPLEDFYFERGLVRIIDANQDHKTVSEDIRVILNIWD